ALGATPRVRSQQPEAPIPRRTSPHGSQPTYDAAILGAGPAGAATARLLATQGHRVVLLTRTPARPGMAESVPPSVGKLLERVGVRGSIDAAAFVRATGNTVWWGGREPRVESFGAGSLGWQVRRDAFDRVLIDEAAAAGVRVVRALVREVEQN